MCAHYYISYEFQTSQIHLSVNILSGCVILLKCSHLVFLKCKSYPVISFLNIKTAQDFPFPVGESSEVAAGLCFTHASECLMAVPGCADSVAQPGDAPGSPVREGPPPYSLSCTPLLGCAGQRSMCMNCSPTLPSPFSQGSTRTGVLMQPCPGLREARS